ncbi:Stromal cell-derived factor 2-like protein 1, partial [Araneus ventricosus]
DPIACGTTIRFEHLQTKKNLHSHHFPSPLSNNQEVSAFGENGEGDTGDHWIVTCSSDNWERSGLVRFKHADTDM